MLGYGPATRCTPAFVIPRASDCVAPKSLSGSTARRRDLKVEGRDPEGKAINHPRYGCTGDRPPAATHETAHRPQG